MPERLNYSTPDKVSSRGSFLAVCGNTLFFLGVVLIVIKTLAIKTGSLPVLMGESAQSYLNDLALLMFFSGLVCGARAIVKQGETTRQASLALGLNLLACMAMFAELFFGA